MAREQSLDLVEIAPKATPPVCKIIDYSKFKYEQKKRNKEIKANSQKVLLKEIRFGPNTDQHDFQFKMRHAETFLNDGNKVKVTINKTEFILNKWAAYKITGLQNVENISNSISINNYDKYHFKFA